MDFYLQYSTDIAYTTNIYCDTLTEQSNDIKNTFYRLLVHTRMLIYAVYIFSIYNLFTKQYSCNLSHLSVCSSGTQR